jgi:uncharacterized membrane protein YraQ (UPF0718 family)
MTFVKKNKLFVFVFLIYFFLLIFDTNKAVQSFDNSLYYLKEMFLVMPVVIVFTILISAWIPQKTIMKYLGSSSGVKGNVLAIVIGMLSTGPIYAAFPIAGIIKLKGGSTQNVVIILSTWAVVKVPMLFNEVKFLGFEFMITRWILTIISIVILAKLTEVIVDKLERKSEVITK